MALTDENGGVGATMLVSPTGVGGNGMGSIFGGDLSILVLFFLFMMMGGWGGNFGGYGGGINELYPWMNNSQNINSGFRDQMLGSQISGIQNSITSGFGDVATALCGSFAGVNASVNGAQNAITQQMYANQIADLERSFAAQTASTAGMTGLQAQLADCCCRQSSNTAELKYVVSTEACADRAAIASALRDVIDATQNQTQLIIDKMNQQEIDALKSQNLALQNQVNLQALAASQTAQTAQLIADNTAQTQYIVNRVAPYPVPAYTVANPITPAA